MPGGAKRRSLAERWRRWFASAEENEAADRAERTRESGAQPIGEARARAAVILQGIVKSMVNDPENGWLTAELADGTGTIRLVWMGWKQLRSVSPGTHLLVRGRITQQEGELVIFNPSFVVLP